MPMPSRSARSVRAAVVAAWLLAACDASPVGSDAGAPPPLPGTPAPALVTAAEARTIATTNAFGLSLFREVSQRRAGRTLFISPYSAAVALGMTLNGAVGTTAEGMQRTLGVSSSTRAEINESYRLLAHRLLAADTSVRFVNANAIWYDRTLGVQQAFLDTTRRYFDAQVEGLDFGNVPAAVARVNDWARARTEGRIVRVLETIRPGEDVMFLMNALYFKGDWTRPFPTVQTSAQPFTRADGTTQTVSLMSQRATYAFWRTGDLEAVELPYGGGRFAMTVVMPGAGRSLDQLVTGLTAARWQQLTDSLRPADMLLSLPRFTLTYEDEWKDVLSAMGMAVAFTPGQADFSALSPAGRRLFLQFVRQKAFVGVNERGTEAGAVTTVGVGIVSMPMQFRVDRAFVFAIRERTTGAILFLGKVAAI